LYWRGPVGPGIEHSGVILCVSGRKFDERTESGGRGPKARAGRAPAMPRGAGLIIFVGTAVNQGESNRG